MGEWRRIKWTRADQAVGEAFRRKAQAVSLDAALEPAAYFAALRKASRLDLAAEFLAHALPRLEAVVWAVDTVRALAPPASPAEVETLRLAHRWTLTAEEANRRAAADAAEACEPSSPAWMAAMAAFYSGGSVAPLDSDPLPPPADATARLAAGAILVACARTADMDTALAVALDLGERLAEDGVGARAAA